MERESGHKAGGGAARARFVISPTMPRLAPCDHLLNLPDAEVRRPGEHLDLVDDTRRRRGPPPQMLAPRLGRPHAAVTRSLMSDDSSPAIAPMMVNIARPIGLSVSI